MQIFPSVQESSGPAFIQANGSEPEIPQSAPFASLMEDIARKARQQESAVPPAHQMHSHRQAAKLSEGEHGMGQGVKVSREDFAALREKLAKQGLSHEDIQSLEDRIASKQGLTWKDMLGFVAEKLNISLDAFCPEITASMRNELSALFNKLGFSHEQGEKLIQELENGNQRQVWRILSKHTAGLQDQELENITRQELKTLSSALGLSPKSINRLESMLAGDPSMALPPKGARLALNTIFSESAKLQNQFEEKLGELRGLIEKGLQLAHKNKDMQGLADNKESKDVSTAKVLIKDEAEKNYRHGKNGENADSTDKKANAAEATKKQDVSDKAGIVGSGKNAKDTVLPGAETLDAKSLRNLKGDSAENESQTKGDTLSRAESLFGSKDASKDLGDKGNSPQQDPNRKAFDDMWSRIVAGGQTKGETAFQQAERIVNQNFSANPELGPEKFLGEKVPPQGIARTVQNGILQNLQQGGKQLTLRLDPASLGKLTVILQVHNNEVRASIRTESNEATRLVNDQINLIKHTLEQQGLKVEKMDVQTQTQHNDQNRNWQGAEEHNQAQQQNKDSLRSAMRGLQKNAAADEPLAHEMQSPGGEETSSQQRLHLIA